MAELYRSDICDVDISKSLVRSNAGIVLATGDSNANRFGAVLYRSGEAVDLTGCAVMGYFIRPNSETVVCEGAHEGNTVYVDLPDACYTEEGTFTLAVKVSSTEATGTVRVIDGVVRLTQTDTLIDPGEVVPSLDELLAHITEVEAATEAAKAVSEEIEAVSALRGIPVTDWEQGVIASATGASGSSTTRCRSGYHRVLAGSEVRVSPNGQQYIVYTYDSDKSYTGRLSDGWVTAYTAAAVDFDGYIRMCVSRTDSTTIKPDDVDVTVELIPNIVSAIEDIRDANAAIAPPIVCEAVGEVASLTDASDSNAMSVVSNITAVQGGEGDPTPDNVRLITGRNAVQLWHGAAYDAAAEPSLIAELPEIVYGGTLDWVTGLLTITHFVQTFDGTEDWTLSTDGYYQYYDDVLYAKTASTNQVAYHVCSHFKADRYKSTGNADNTCHERNNNKLMVKCGSITTLANWTAYLAVQAASGTPMTIVWEYLPKYYTTIQLDAQTLTLLKGSNALWSDTGDTAVTYVADTKLYIDNKFTALQNAILAQGANI